MQDWDVSVSDRFDFDGEAYRSLYEVARVTGFQHPLWLSGIYERLASARDAAPLIVTVRETASRRLVLVLPLVRRRIYGLRVIEYANFGVVDYACPIVAPGLFDRPFGDSEFQRRLSQALQPYDVLRIKHLRPEDLDLARMLERPRVTAMEFSGHVVDLGTAFPEWREKTLSRSFRKMLDRKRRALSQRGEIRFATLSQPHDIAEAFERMRALRQPRFRQREGEDLLQDRTFHGFYLDAAQRGAATGFSRTQVLQVGSETVAVLFGICVSRRFYYLLLGADYESFGKHSPGLLMFENSLMALIGEGMQVFDFTIGDEPFKAQFGASARPIHAVWHAGTMGGRLASRAAETARRTRWQLRHRKCA